MAPIRSTRPPGSSREAAAPTPGRRSSPRRPSGSSSSPTRASPSSGSTRPIPLELSPFGLKATLRELGQVRLRDAPPSPDGGLIADYDGEVGDPAALAGRLDAVPGVVAHGLFPPELVSDVLIGRGQTVERREP